MSNDTPRGLRSARVGVAMAIVAGVVVASGAMAWALNADDDPSPAQAATSSATPADEHDHADTGDEAGHDHDGAAAAGAAQAAEADADEAASEAAAQQGAGPGHRHGAGHDHPELPPYDERDAEATDDERDAADALLADVRDTLADYADADAAVAAGYRPAAHPVHPGSRVVHYANPQVIQDGRVLEPADPNGLVYYTPPEGDPVLLGAFFVVPPGTAAPTPAGDLMVWHSHDPSCSQFWVEDGQHDCLDTRRMVHVWTAEQVELTSRRTDQPVDVRITDPFGAPFMASIERTE